MEIYDFKKEFFMHLALSAYKGNEDKRRRIRAAHEIWQELAIAEQILDRLEENKELDVKKLVLIEKKIKAMKKLVSKAEG